MSSSANRRRRLIDEVRANRDAVLDRIVRRARAEIPGYAALPAGELRPLTENMLDHMATIVAEQRPPSADELRAFRAFGAVRGRQRISLEDILRAWRMAVRELLDEFTAVGRSHNIGDRVLLDLTSDLLEGVDRAILEFSGGHREVELERVREDDRLRADFVQTTLLGRIGPADLGVRIQRYGLDADHTYIPFRARPTEAIPARDIERTLALGPSVFTTTIDGDLAGFTAHLAGSGVLAPVGTGPAAPLDRIPASFARATRALNTAVAFELPGVHELADLGLLPAVLADAEIGDQLVHRYLEPVLDSEHFDELADTLHHYLETGRHVEQAARVLYVHPNTIRYRLNRYRELTGIDLRRPAAALELWWALRRAELKRPGASRST